MHKINEDKIIKRDLSLIIPNDNSDEWYKDNFILKTRTWNQLRENGVSTIKEVMYKSEQELINFPGIGRHIINDLKENLQKLNKKLGTNYWIGEKIPVQLELEI